MSVFLNRLKGNMFLLWEMYQVQVRLYIKYDET